MKATVPLNSRNYYEPPTTIKYKLADITHKDRDTQALLLRMSSDLLGSDHHESQHGHINQLIDVGDVTSTPHAD